MFELRHLPEEHYLRAAWLRSAGYDPFEALHKSRITLIYGGGAFAAVVSVFVWQVTELPTRLMIILTFLLIIVELVLAYLYFDLRRKYDDFVKSYNAAAKIMDENPKSFFSAGERHVTKTTDAYLLRFAIRLTRQEENSSIDQDQFDRAAYNRELRRFKSQHKQFISLGMTTQASEELYQQAQEHCRKVRSKK